MTGLILLIFGTRNYCVQFLSRSKSSIMLPWGEGVIEKRGKDDGIGSP